MSGWAGLVVAALCLGACAGPAPAGRGLEAIRERGELRVVVRPGFGRAAVPGSRAGEDLAVLEHAARKLGVRLAPVEAARNDQVLPAVIAGTADVAVWRLPAPPALSARLLPSAPLDWVDDVLVEWTGMAASSRDRRPALWLHRSNPYWGAEDLGPPERLFPAPEEIPLETVLERVAAGRYGATVTDTGLLAAARSRLQVRTVKVLAEHRPVTWFFAAGSRDLKVFMDEFLFARRVLGRVASPPACRDLEQIRAAGVLRLITRNGPVTCTVEHGGLSGFEYELARRLALQLGVRLELAVPPPQVEPPSWLEEGRGDLMALHEPAWGRARGGFLLAEGYRRVDLVAVCRQNGPCPASVEDLKSLSVATPGFGREVLDAMGLEPSPTLVSLPPGSDALDALSAVAKGEADVAVVDSDVARIQLEDWEGLRRGAVVARDLPLAWVMNVSSPALARTVRRFLGRAARDGTLRVLAHAELDPAPFPRASRLPDIPTYALTPWDAQLKRAALEYGIDWRLLASLMYEESRFDPKAVGPGGSAGLFQFMPATWRWLGIRDPFDPEEVIPAAARYLRMLMDDFEGLELADQVAMAIASYNVGPAHVMDARRLARQMGRNPDVWRDNVETAMLILDDPEVARRFPAGVCRCRRAVAYTRRILRRYLLYASQF